MAQFFLSSYELLKESRNSLPVKPYGWLLTVFTRFLHWSLAKLDESSQLSPNLYLRIFILTVSSHKSPHTSKTQSNTELSVNVRMIQMLQDVVQVDNNHSYVATVPQQDFILVWQSSNKNGYEKQNCSFILYIPYFQSMLKLHIPCLCVSIQSSCMYIWQIFDPIQSAFL